MSWNTRQGSGWSLRANLLAIVTSIVVLSGLIHVAAARDRRMHGDWLRYHNDRYGFSLSYPANIFQPELTSETGDGQLFKSRSGDARLLVGILPNGDRHTPRRYLHLVVSQSYQEFDVTYRRLGGSWFALSGEGREKTFYEKVVFSCGGRIINSFALIYPTAERHIFDPIVERMEDTFRPDRQGCRSKIASLHKHPVVQETAVQPPRLRERHVHRRVSARRKQTIFVRGRSASRHWRGHGQAPR